MLQLKIKENLKKRVCGGSGICYQSRKIGKILGEGVYKGGHRDLKKKKCVLRITGPTWLNHKG